MKHFITLILILGLHLPALPENHDGQFELAVKFAGDDSITFTPPDGHCTLSYNAKMCLLTFDQTASPQIGADHGHIFKTPALSNSDVRVFFDRSVFEVYADGYVITSRYLSTAPERMSLSHSNNQPITAWKQGGIWK